MDPITKKKISIVILAITLLAEALGLSIAFLTEPQPYLYFTNIGNAFYALAVFLALIAQIVALAKKEQLPRWAFIFHYTGTVCEVLILLTVCLYLVWFQGPKTIYEGSFVFLHLLCPLLAIGNHYFFLGKSNYKFSDGGYGIILPALYAATLIPLSAANIVTPPYPFLDFQANSWWLTLLYAIGYLAIIWLVCYALIRYAEKTQRITEKE